MSEYGDDQKQHEDSNEGYVLVTKHDDGTSIVNHSNNNGTITNNDNDNRCNNRNTSSMIYLNNAGQALLSPKCQQVGVAAITEQQLSSSPSFQNNVRSLFGSLINANSSQIAIMPSSAFAITFATMNIERQLMLKQQKESNKNSDNKDSCDDNCCYGRFLVLQDQMDSAIYPWQDVCDRSNNYNNQKLQLDIVPYPQDGETWTDLIVSKLVAEKETAVDDPNNNNNPIIAVCVPPLHWSDGSAIDLIQIGTMCHELQIDLIVDATQAVGAISSSFLDVTKIQPTLVCCSIHKWLRGPSGMSLVYVSPTVQDRWVPLDQHGRSRICYMNDPTYFDAKKYSMSSTGYPVEYVNDCRKFDSGGKPNPILLPMLQASLEEVTCQVDTIQSYLKELMKPLLDWVNSKSTLFRKLNYNNDNNQFYYHIIGIRPINDRILSIQQLVTICNTFKDKYNICIAVRCGALRISPYLTNTKSDIDSFIVAFEEQIDLLLSTTTRTNPPEIT